MIKWSGVAFMCTICWPTWLFGNLIKCMYSVVWWIRKKNGTFGNSKGNTGTGYKTFYWKHATLEPTHTQSIGSTEETKVCLKSAMLFLWSADQLLAGLGCVCDERRVQMSPATHNHMSSMDPKKTNTDERKQIPSIGSTEETKICLKTAMLCVWTAKASSWLVC